MDESWLNHEHYFLNFITTVRLLLAHFIQDHLPMNWLITEL